MKFLRPLLFVAMLAIAGAASAQFVTGNEAVKAMPDGSKKVETPPSSAACWLAWSRCSSSMPGGGRALSG